MPSESDAQTSLLTLAIDIGGSHLKAGVLSETGEMVEGPTRVETPRPAGPDAVVPALVKLAGSLTRFDRISIGFPGVVRGSTVMTAPNLGSKEWHRFALASEISRLLGKPTRMLNDASIQGLGVIVGHGVECVLTMGTGMGFALFEEGRLGPHLEMSQNPVKTHKTYDEYVGNAALEKIGRRHWNRRMRKVIANMQKVVGYDVLYIGGGNARLMEMRLPDGVKLVPNAAGITGGIRLWDPRMDVMFEGHPRFEA